MKPKLQKLKTLNDLSVTKDHCKNLHAQNLKKTLHIFCSRLLSFSFEWQAKTRPSTCIAR